MIPTSCGSAWARSAGPMPAASATSGWLAGSGSSSASTTSSTAMCPRARRRSGRPTSWPSRSSTASASRAASSPWPSTGMRPPPSTICSASPTPPSPRIGSIAPWTSSSKPRTAIEDDLKDRLGTLFQLDYDLLLYDLTSTYFEGLAEENELAQRRLLPRSPQRLQADRAGPGRHAAKVFPWPTGPAPATRRICRPSRPSSATSRRRFGKSNRVWVMDRGMISKDSLAFLSQSGRRYLLSTRRHALVQFQRDWQSRRGWQRLPDNPDVEVKLASVARSITCWPAANPAAARNAPCGAGNAGLWPRPSRNFTCASAKVRRGCASDPRDFW